MIIKERFEGSQGIEILNVKTSKLAEEGQWHKRKRLNKNWKRLNKTRRDGATCIWVGNKESGGYIRVSLNP